MDPKAYLEMKAVEQEHWWFVARRSILRSILDQLDLPKNAKILEIGCGTGGNLKLLSTYGQVDAIEMNPDAVALVQREYGDKVHVIQGALPGVSTDLIGRYDLVCMFDVLEHIADEGSALDDVKSLLKASGRLLVTVPAYAWLWGTHDEFLHHQRRYTLDCLAQCLKAAGLSSIRLSYFNSLLFPLVAIGRLFDKLLKPTSPTGTAVPPAGLNRLLKSVFASERYLLKFGRIPFGVSLMALAKKNGSSFL